jgi:hypothetical protein
MTPQQRAAALPDSDPKVIRLLMVGSAIISGNLYADGQEKKRGTAGRDMPTFARLARLQESSEGHRPSCHLEELSP